MGVCVYLEYGDGTKWGPSQDFHVVAGPLDAEGNESNNVYSKNGRRPIENGTGTNASFKPKDKDEARANNRTNAIAKDDKGRPIYKVRANMRERKIFVPTIESVTASQSNSNSNQRRTTNNTSKKE